MLPVDAPFTPWVVGVVLALLLGALVVHALRRDRREYALFKRLRGTVRRQRMLRKWLLLSFGSLGGAGVILLLLVWGFVGSFVTSVEAWPAMVWLRDAWAGGSGVLWGAAVGALIGVVVLAVWGVFAARPKAGEQAEVQDADGSGASDAAGAGAVSVTVDVDTLGDIEALLPRNRAELKYGWLLSINAGVVEELLFRLALPVALFAVVGDSVVAVLVSLVVFGLMHAYQGVAGVLGTFVFGALMMGVFLVSGSIVWAMLLHALFDLRSLVLIPVVVRGVHRV